MPAASKFLPATSKVCSSCRLVVARSDCHKNRYGEYICRACQASGVRFTRRRRFGFLGGRLFTGAWVGLTVAVVLALVSFTTYVLVAHVELFGLLRSVVR
jgi:hypothetical protein